MVDTKEPERILYGPVKFQRMYEGFMPWVSKIASAHFSQEHAASIANEVMVRGWRNLAKIDLDSPDVKRWFRAAIMSAGIDVIRAEGRHSAVSFDSQLTRNSEPSDHTYEPERVVLNRELGLIVGRAIDSLPQLRRTITRQRLIYGATELETAERTGEVLGTVKSNFNRSKETLQKNLAELRDPEHSIPGLGAVYETNDKDLIESVILDERTHKYLMNIARRIAGNAFDAEDAVQITQLIAWDKLDQFNGSNPKAWMVRILTNQIYNNGRRKMRRPEQEIPEFFEVRDESPYSDPTKAILEAEVLETIHKAINKLPDEQQVAVELSDIQGLSYAEIAEIEGVSIGTVKSRLSRARARIRIYLIQNHPDLVNQFEKITPEEIVG